MTLPPGFTHQAQRGTDSYPGRIVAQDSSLVIHYDIGFLAGARVNPSRRSDFLWFLEHEVNGYRAYSGVFLEGQDRRLATTVIGDGSDPRSFPANFVASVRGEREVAAFMLIVTELSSASRKGETLSGSEDARLSSHHGASISQPRRP